ncbi:MAG: efflux RND transporter periplasmic adaptor subunit [Polyangiaceae bacterium]
MDVPSQVGGSSAREEAPAAPRTPAPAAARAAGNGAGRGERVDLERELASVGRRTWTRRLVIVGVIVALVVAGRVWRARTRPPPPPRYVTATTSRGDVTETVQSTGQIKPVTEVQVGAQVSGRITKVYVDFNSKVKAGDVLAEIDPTLFGAQIDQSRAQLAASAASVKRAESNLLTSKQRVDRARRLVTEGIGSQADMDTAQGAYDVALADLAAAKAQVSQIAAQLRSSNTNLEYTRIFSPIDGIVINRAIDPGQTVAASFQAPVLFVIAQDLSKMRVLADVDEADVGRLKDGMTAKITVDAFPGETFAGTVSQVRFSPVSTSGVVTYAAVVEVDNKDLKLRPGMTATVTVTTAESKNIQRVPNAALRFKPSPPLDKEGKPLPEQKLPALPPKRGRVWVVTDETPGAEKAELREVDIGVSDGVVTEVHTDLGAAKIVTDETDDPNAKKGKGPRLF